MSQLAVRSGAKKRRLFAIEYEAKENGKNAAKKQASSTTNLVTDGTPKVSFDDEDAYVNHFGEPDKECIVKLAEEANQASSWTRTEPEESPLGSVMHCHLSSTSAVDLKRMLSSVPSSLRLRRRFDQLSSLNPAASIERSMLAAASHYHDILISNRTVDKAKPIRDAYAFHAMCHVLRGRDKVMKNNAKLATAAANKDEMETPRDQGFTRPKVLVIVPFRNAAFEVIQALIKFSGSEQQENKHRFESEYGISDENEKINMSKPKDYLEYFKGNTNDMFCLGMKLTRKTLKLYSAMMSSDIIVASPLGLRMAIGDEGEPSYDYDFLSSIEVLIIDQCEAILMQNWNHIEYIWQHLNKIPQQPRGTDFSRIKEWYLDGLAPYVRQNIILSPFLTPEINHLFTKEMKNVQGGKIKTIPKNNDMITSASISMRQVFYRFDSASAAADPETRFQTFVKKILPNLTSSIATQGHVLIFISTYHDFVRVRNHFDEQNISFDSCNDYSTGKDMTRARARFFSGESKYLLYTQRLHFYRRPTIRGTKAVVFYGLPDKPEFYLEMLQGVKGTADKPSQCTAMFSKYDRLKLERIVGDVRAARMCESAVDNVYVFE